MTPHAVLRGNNNKTGEATTYKGSHLEEREREGEGEEVLMPDTRGVWTALCRRERERWRWCVGVRVYDEGSRFSSYETSPSKLSSSSLSFSPLPSSGQRSHSASLTFP